MEYFLWRGQGLQSLFTKESGSLPSFTLQPENNFLKQLSGFFGRRKNDLPANMTFLQSTWVIMGCASRRKFNSCVAPKICNQGHGRASRRKTQPPWRAHEIETYHGLSAQETMGINHPPLGQNPAVNLPFTQILLKHLFHQLTFSLSRL